MAVAEAVKGTVTPDARFFNEVASRAGGENLGRCYACGTCTVSCPIFEIKPEYNPRRIIRMIVLGMKKELMRSEIFWSCVNCYTCFERCPQDVRFTTVVHALKNIAVREGRARGTAPRSPAYVMADCFMESVRLHGRMWESELMVRLWLKLRDPARVLSFVKLGLRMFLKGRVEMVPSRVKGMEDITRIFRAVAARAAAGGGKP
jgi:heterodisulfide reductase subunit C